MKCKVCSSDTQIFDQAQILKKYMIDYFRCPQCGFIQTEQPYWLAETYASPIGDDDTGLVARNLMLAQFAYKLIKTCFNHQAEFLDYGGGYGLFVRLMRDANLCFFRYDRYCQNLFAHGFDRDISSSTKYELISAFEVFEHFTHPLRDISEIMQVTKSVLFSTELISFDTPPRPHQWRYYSLNSGGHISFYTVEALTIIARKYSLKLYTDKRWVHIFSEKDMQIDGFVCLK